MNNIVIRCTCADLRVLKIKENSCMFNISYFENARTDLRVSFCTLTHEEFGGYLKILKSRVREMVSG